MPAIGDIIWTWDPNLRSSEGIGWGTYARRQVVGETRVSWLVSHVGGKPDSFDVVRAPKKKWPGEYLLSLEEVNQRKWIGANRHGIADAIHRFYGPGEYEVLKKIAELIGYKER